jgi:hypothetical protein
MSAAAPRFGVSYRSRWRRELLETDEAAGCLEIIAEHFLRVHPDRPSELEALAAGRRVLPHGISLSLGTDAPLNQGYLRAVSRLLERVQAPWFSEHLSFSGVPGLSIGHLAPLPLTHEALTVVCRNIRQWRAAAGVPLLLENIAYLVAIPGDMTEMQFISEVLDRTECGLLLDLHNLYANARNHGFDAPEWLAEVPMERVRQVHIAGGHDENGVRIDSHSAPAPPEVWELLRVVARSAPLEAIVVEWDVKLPPYAVILAELQRARSIVHEATHVAA